MPFDTQTRNKLARLVAQARQILVDEFTRQLQELYGLQPDGTIIDVDRLTHLGDQERSTARMLRDRVRHLASGERQWALGSGQYAEKESTAAAVDRLIREQAFTVLNRLAALRMCEERQLVEECVRQGMQSKGFKVFETVAGASLGETYDRYKTYLSCLFDEIALDLGVLFDRFSTTGLLFPREKALLELLDLLNTKDLQDIWAEDETIGWIYQYFNSPEERKRMREESAAPRNSRELAVRNQFFTPRYVVEFLTDNTLGRLWYEMRQGDTALKEQCRYLVRRPDEVFMDKTRESEVERAVHWLNGEEEKQPELWQLAHTVNGYLRAGQAGEVANTWLEDRLPRLADPIEVSKFKTQELLDLLFIFCRKERFCEGTMEEHAKEINLIQEEIACRVEKARNKDLSQEELLKTPVIIPYRAKKDPRDLKILDPACGSGHFLLYAFDLLETIYQEAWEDGNNPAAEATGTRLQEDYKTLAALRRAIPELILRHNLHGIDIDPRAVQIAALSLWLRAQKSWQAQTLKPAERPRITRANLVTAEPMPGDADLRREFIAGLQPRVLGQLVQVVFDKMQLAGEAGSLLKIEAEIAEAVAEARKQWRQQQGLAPKKGEPAVFPGFLTPKPQQRDLLFEVGEITEAEFWEEAEGLILAALKDYAERVENGHGLRRHLFAEDAARGFALIDLCRQRYDVVLMNPPFGEAAKASKGLLEKSYPRSKQDMYAAFVERGLGLQERGGRLGAITSRTGFFLSSFTKWREEILLKEAKPVVFADLGYGVMDAAMVEAAAYCLEAKP